MADRTIQIGLKVNADTSEAKNSLDQLKQSLENLTKVSVSSGSLVNSQGLKDASKAAAELHTHLTKATNVKTGKIDLSQLSLSLKSANTSIGSLSNKLLRAGSQGQEAFVNLAQNIAAADRPVAQINKKLSEMGDILLRTAKWQISSSLIHGIMGAFQSAYGYAQDLDESLNKIRIVTGQSSDKMAQFAKEANKAAKALGATTTAYTDAALIYYQAGLNDEQVKERTEATIKMSNVTGESAEEVSSYMTAIWNNFDDGSKSLEHYADVITALGAATASSSAEIAEGLEKFAAIGNTVGLSYEYATTALATVVAQTRQSADTVGTALKLGA